ncbi:CLUMA_CG017773, isoform A [Clunio marinus]|uniref:CLUMA_CG017773, isoform A n=1 Tax=Clunio marinus TaxID=568069 RepID=A0A1J1J1I0_9DIPT|nr:CLUMA_CG017773, isoform A [Clunio marinus]
MLSLTQVEILSIYSAAKNEVTSPENNFHFTPTPANLEIDSKTILTQTQDCFSFFRSIFIKCFHVMVSSMEP